MLHGSAPRKITSWFLQGLFMSIQQLLYTDYKPVKMVKSSYNPTLQSVQFRVVVHVHPAHNRPLPLNECMTEILLQNDLLFHSRICSDILK